MGKFSKLKISAKTGFRGTEDCAAMLDTLRDHFDPIREKFLERSDEEREEMMDYLNSAMENLGDMLFGDDATADDLQPYVSALDDEQQDLFVATVNETLIVESNEQ